MLWVWRGSRYIPAGQTRWVAAKRLFNRLLRSYGGDPKKIVIDKLRSCGVAHRELIPETIHSTKQYENNRAEQSHEATRLQCPRTFGCSLMYVIPEIEGSLAIICPVCPTISASNPSETPPPNPISRTVLPSVARRKPPMWISQLLYQFVLESHLNLQGKSTA